MEKIGCFLAQTVACNELVGSTKLSFHATCHFAWFFSQPPLAFYFSLRLKSSRWPPPPWNPLVGRGVLAGSHSPCACHTSQPRSNWGWGGLFPFEEGAVFSAEPRRWRRWRRSAPRPRDEPRRPLLCCSLGLFPSQGSMSAVWPHPVSRRGCLCAQCRLLFSASGESEGAKGRK